MIPQNKAVLFTDGGSRGNPGPGAIGFVFYNQGKKVFSKGKKIGLSTNNIAEYTALIEGLREVLKTGYTGDLLCLLDSELVVKQLTGLYKVKNQKLRPLFEKVLDLAKRFKKVSFQHIPREQNAEADLLVNKALDNLL
ncbi:MAG TPA: ribonuclease HI family protein [candidate division WWE3 bacterium]|uniref:Ribonuclease HI family protein n=1 Tax=candidate division WWE3 bacterium TaxID=2053526 RepID=A0A7V5MH12_UNCKA|nr:ribonuclease HI family protein [candidate division WWE3 bacterium]